MAKNVAFRPYDSEPMSVPLPEPETSRRIRIRRFPDWRALRASLADHIHQAPHPLLVLTGTEGARAALGKALQRQLLKARSAAVLPEIRTPALAIEELLLRSHPPGRLATPLARSLMMENALLEAAGAEDAPCGNPLRLSGPFLRFLDEQARDRSISPDRPAFRALLERALRTFHDAEEIDEGAGRLLKLTGWLQRVHRGYLAQLEAAGALDLDLARRRLLTAAPRLPWAAIHAVGDPAMGTADVHLFGTLFAPEPVCLSILEGDPAPELPTGWTVEEETVAAPAPVPPRILVPPESTGDEDTRFLFRATDRPGEVRMAVALLSKLHRQAGPGFAGFERCAIAARKPGVYLDALATCCAEAGIPFQTRLKTSLSEEPWPAGLDDALAFAEDPGRLTNGIALLRSPFFYDAHLPGAPGRMADVTEYALADADFPNTQDPGQLEGLAARVRRLGDERIAQAQEAADDVDAFHKKRSGRELRLAAEVVERLDVHARTLAPLRQSDASFRDAVRRFASFVRLQFPGAADQAALEALEQAADPALPETRVGTPQRFRDRIRRQLRRHSVSRYSGTKGVHLISAEDAPFGDYDCLILLGTGDADWPSPRPANIFLPTRVLEHATRVRFGAARRREAQLLTVLAGLAGDVTAFVRAELEDGFPAGESSLFPALRTKLEQNPQQIRFAIPDASPRSAAAPLPANLERPAPGAVDLASRFLSPSALVLYARNPAQFFLERVLRLRREETLTDTGSRTARGSRLHRLMEEAMPAFVERHGPVVENNLDAALDFFRERYRTLHGPSSNDPGLTPAVRAAEELWLFGGDSHPAALEWFLREEAARGPSRPSGFEKVLQGTVEPVEGSLPPLRVRGSVDRVDVTADGRMRVLEYKSGSSAGKESALLQARLYARLVNPAEPAEIGVPFFGDRVWSEPAKVAELDEKIRTVRDGLAAGEFPVPTNPKEIKPFDWPLAIRSDLPATPPEPRPVGTPASVVLPVRRKPPPSFRPSDHAARLRAADPGRNVVLRASAGTGKTTILTERYLNLIRAGVPPRNILALTFTRKAAAEMKDRIVGRLGDPDLGKETDLGKNPDLAEIAVSTLDAFNLGLIREFPLDAGVAPGVEVLDEREMPVVQQQAAERVITGRTGFAPQALAELPLLGKSLARLDDIAKAYLENRLTWRVRFEEAARRLETRPPSARPVLRAQFGPAEPQIRRFLAGYGAAVPLQGRLAFRLIPQGGSRDALDREFLQGWLRPDLSSCPRGTKKILTGVWDEYRELKAVQNQFSIDWLDFLNDRTFPPVWDLLQAVEAEYGALKEERGVMDFDDLTAAATHMLRSTGEFSESRFRLEARYHHLLLDEFQDTSDPQWELLQAIAKPWTTGEGLAAEEVQRVTRGRLQAPTLFVVGDHKQSIYRFRNARVEILGRAEAWMRRKLGAQPDLRQALRWNFRSTAPLRAFVNDAAAAVAEADSETEADWRFAYEADDRFPEEPGPADEGGFSGAPLTVSVVADGDDPQEATREAARRVAARVAELAALGVPLGEIAILSRASTRLAAYREAVERLGIPTYLVRGTGFFDTSEIRDLTSLCRFLARPHSDLRAVELLRSRFFAIPSRTLASLRQAGREAETPFSDLLASDGDTIPDLPVRDAAPLREAGAQVGRWLELSKRLPPSLAIQRILEETDYLNRARATSTGGPFDGQQQAANVEKALQHLRRVERDGFATFSTAARHLESAAPNGHDGTQAPLRAEGAVQVLTIHAAKGLEYEHLFLVDLNAKPGGRRSGLRVQEGDDNRWSVALINASRDWEIRDAGRSSAEERRCLYVGMTRARKGLTLSATTKFRKDGDPYQPQGLAGYLPADLWHAAANTAREAAGEIRWKRHRIAVLPPSDSA